MRRSARWGFAVLAAVVLVAVATLALVVLGGRDPDWNGTVLVRWDPQRRALEFMVRPKPGLDGPYLFRAADGYRIARMVGAGSQWTLQWRRHVGTAPPRVVVQVDDAARTSFTVQVRPPATPPLADLPANPSRLLMLSDFEGEFERFVALLQAQGVIDDGLRWRYGDGHLALAGDFVDRGEHVIALLWLVYRLEGEAARAGGAVHYVLGNHELMGLNGNAGAWPSRMLATAQRMGRDGQSRVFAGDSVLGQWLRTRPVIARIGDHLVVHGGVSADFMRTGLSVEDANALARPWLDRRRMFMPAAVQPVLGRAGVTRYRGLAVEGERREADLDAHLRRIATRYGVRRIAIGHSLAPDVMLEHGGRVLRLDVHHRTQVPQAALYQDGILWRVDARGQRTQLAGGRFQAR